MQPCRFAHVQVSVPKRLTSLSLLALLLVAGPTLFAGCGDDGKLLGTDGGAGSSGQTSAGNSASSSGQASGGGSSGQASGGSSVSSAGSGQAGMLLTNSGAPGGGSTSGGTGGVGTAGKAGAGGATCALPEGCLAGGGQGNGGQGSGDCVGMTCTASQMCVATRTVGGALPPPPDTQGNCMTGSHVENNVCQPDFAYQCEVVPGCSTPAECVSKTPNCRLPSPVAWLDPSAELICERFAP